MGNRRVLSLVFLALLVLAALWVSGPPRTHAVPFGEELRHSNGLRTAVPSGYKLDAQMPEGFSFDRAKPQRLVDHIQVWRSASRPELKASGLQVLTKSATYMVEDVGGGSGGTEYQLTAFREVPGGWIVVVAVQQSEFLTPRFEAGWAVLERSTIETP